MKGDKWRETRRQRQPRPAQNGDYKGRHMKGDKAAAAAKTSPEWRLWRETNEGRQGGSGSQDQPRMEIMKGDKWRRQGGSSSQDQPRMEIMKGDKWRETRRQRPPRPAQNGDYEGRRMKGDKAAAAAKTSPEWRLWRGTNEGRQGGSGSQDQPRMEIMKGDKWRETRRQRQPRPAQNGDYEGRQMKGAAAKTSPEWRSWRETNEGRQGGSSSQDQLSGFWGSATQSLRSKNPYSFQRHHDHLGILGISNPVIEK